jgi:hypothetical protein
MAEEGTAEGEDRTAVGAEDSMEAVAEPTTPGVVAAHLVAGGTTAHRAGGLSVAAAAIAAVHPRQLTEAAPRTAE